MRLETPGDFATIGMTVTRMPALNAIAAVVGPARAADQRRPTPARIRRTLQDLAAIQLFDYSTTA
jgi:hypothetical protein